jgi:hypothetical protein
MRLNVSREEKSSICLGHKHVTRLIYNCESYVLTNSFLDTQIWFSLIALYKEIFISCIPRYLRNIYSCTLYCNRESLLKFGLADNCNWEYSQ